MLKPKLVITIEAGEWTLGKVEDFIEWLDEELGKPNRAFPDNDTWVTDWRVEEESEAE